MGEPCIAQSGREVERADHLRHTDAGLAGNARIAVSHIGRRLFAVGMDALDGAAPLHLDKGPPQHRRHHEHMRDAVAVEHLGETFRTGHFSVVSEHDGPRSYFIASGLVGEPTAPVIGMAGATNMNS